MTNTISMGMLGGSDDLAQVFPILISGLILTHLYSAGACEPGLGVLGWDFIICLTLGRQSPGTGIQT